MYFSVAGVAAASGAGGRRGRAATIRWPSSSGWRRAGIDWCGVEHAEGESFRWKGKYSYDLQSRETLETRLGVFADFQPKLPEAFRSARVPLPRQHRSRAPARRARAGAQADAGGVRHDELLDPEQEGRRCSSCSSRVDVLMVNDGEARELSGDWNIHRAGRWILAHGPKRVVIKQGEYGALLIEPNRTFYVPAFPLENVFDPTGAGDAFAGGFMALPRAHRLGLRGQHPPGDGRTARPWARTRSSSSASAASTGSRSPTSSARVRAFEDLTHVEPGGAARRDVGRRVRRGRRRPRRAPTRPRRGSAGSWPAPARRSRWARSARSAAWCGCPPGMRQPDAGAQHRRRRHQGAGRARRPGASTRWARTSSTTASTTSWCTAPADRVHGLHRRRGARRRADRRASSRASRAGAGPTAWRWPAARRRRCRGSTSRAPTTSPGTIIGVVEEDEALHGDAHRAGRRAAGLRLDRAPHQRLHAGPAHRLRADGPRARRPAGRHRADASPMRCWRCTGATSPSVAAGARPGARARAHHRRRHRRQPGPGAARGMRGRGGPDVLDAAAALHRAAAGRRGSRPTRCATSSTSASGLIAVLPADAVDARAQARGTRGRRRDLGHGRDPSRSPTCGSPALTSRAVALSRRDV